MRASERVHIQSTNCKTESAQVLVQQLTMPRRPFQSSATTSIRQFKSLHATDKIDLPLIFRLQERPQSIDGIHSGNKIIPRIYKIVQQKSIHFQCCDQLLLRRPGQSSLSQLSNLSHDTQWFFLDTRSLLNSIEISIGSSFFGSITNFLRNFRMIFMIFNSFSIVIL